MNDGREVTSGTLGRRARNVYRRPLLFGVVAVSVFMVTLIVLLLIPREAQRAAQVAGALAPNLGERRDTTEILRHLQAVEQLAHIADSSRAEALELSRRLAAAVDTLSPDERARHDSLSAVIASLAALIQRAENAPLPASYRALGESREMRTDPRVKGMLDSLAAIEKARSDLGPSGEVDPIFVALTSRGTQIGKRLVAVAAERAGELRQEAARMVPRPPPSSTMDTAAMRAMRDSLSGVSASLQRELADARQANAILDAREERARRVAALGATPLAMLAAAIVMGLAVGFGVSFAFELQRPHVADSAEAVLIAGAPVLARLADSPPATARRRLADREVPPLIEQGVDAYRMLYMQLADRSFNLPFVVVVGDEPLTTATVAGNLAAAAARQMRTVLLVDTDAVAQSVTWVTRTPGGKGLADVVSGRLSWPEAIVGVVVGRERTMDVLATGTLDASRVPGAASMGPDAAAGAEAERTLDATLEHLRRRYETIVVNAPASRGAELHRVVRTSTMVLLCVRTARTPASVLRDLAGEIARRGAVLRGLALWEPPDPVAIAPRQP